MKKTSLLLRISPIAIALLAPLSSFSEEMVVSTVKSIDPKSANLWNALQKAHIKTWSAIQKK